MIYINTQYMLDTLLESTREDEGTPSSRYRRLRKLGRTPTAADVKAIFGDLQPITIHCTFCGKRVDEAVRLELDKGPLYNTRAEEVVIIMCPGCIHLAMQGFEDGKLSVDG